MVWVEIHGVTEQSFIYSEKISTVASSFKEKKMDDENREYIFEGTVSLAIVGYFIPLTVAVWEYRKNDLKPDKRLKHPDKIKQDIDQLKRSAYLDAKERHKQRVSKIVRKLQLLKQDKEQAIFYLMEFLKDIESTD